MSRDNRAAYTQDSIQKLPNGKWRARPTLGVDPKTGRLVRPTKTFGTKTDARAWVKEQRRQWDNRTWAARSDRTFTEVADHWLSIRDADPDIRANTVRADRESLAYARRAFGDTPVQRLTPASLIDWSLTLTTLAGQPLAASTKRRAIGSVQQVLKHAMRMRWITFDPSAELDAPAQREVVASDARDVWTPEQMDQFLDSVLDHRLAGCFALTLLGLRREEVGGLRWCDVDLDRGELRIRQARVDVNGVDIIDEPKTARSVRDLPIPPRELTILRKMRVRHASERLAVGNPLADTDLLMSQITGTPLPVRKYTELFRKRRTMAGLPPVLLRNLRHSNVSRMRAAGVPADVIASWHGHTERMTTAVYGRVTDDRLKDAALVFGTAANDR
ncbi:tyrosine-type recombinase/integrase [Gordonia neofelifaecis]|uniref:Site-specific recombinase XerD n=1 Tax=Gordonia neofelifaecis NRRL B-59395 TaxID=644548 RepID=F1YEA7_9ACTN|nr:tyrosine-type recombinase/integrase [Gordonia neofelifaecis]EGD56740.1 site-specific recombinase XerD [Gordonia neofelifaecis NRRL B-59395]